jgi:ferrous iron transport protein B
VNRSFRQQDNRPTGNDTTAAVRTLRVALAGNPNSGKTSLFNTLTGGRQHIGNYPGVTVEKKQGRIDYRGYQIEFVDLPGTYSLSAYSLEEVVTRDYLLTDPPDIIIDVIDSTNLERNMYLLLQFQELGIPVIGALNMTDEAQRQGLRINDRQLGKILGIPFVKTVGRTGRGKFDLLKVITKIAQGTVSSNVRHLNYGPELEQEHNKIIDVLQTDPAFVAKYPPHWMAIKLLEEDDDAFIKIKSEHHRPDDVLQTAATSRAWIANHFGEDSPTIVGEQRYAYIRGAIRETVIADRIKKRIDTTEKIDAVILNRYLGVLVFFGIMFLIYRLTFSLGNPLADYLEVLFSYAGQVLNSMMPESMLRDLLVDGIIGGVGGVLTFFPIVILLFIGLSFLEDVGYMARAAFVMDKFFHIFGMHGRSFIPFMISTGCAVPGVMSARTLVNPKDRIITVLVAPIMICGAKTPVIAMLAAAFFPEHAGTVFWSVWFFAWLLAFSVGWVFRKTLFRGESSPFVMELPPYRMPTARGILTHMWDRSWMYVRKAGTIILAISIIIWFLLYFPKPSEYSRNYPALQAQLADEYADRLAGLSAEEKSIILNELEEKLAALSRQQTAEELNYSIAGRIGAALEPIFRPAGFDWKINIALFAGFAAKEVIISTTAIVHGIGDADNHAFAGLKERLVADPHYTPAVALALMVFVLIYAPCMPVQAVIRKELGGWKWSALSIGYTMFLAWILAVAVYHLGKLIGLG